MKMLLRAVVVDDEVMARRRIRRLLEEEGGVEVVAECEDGASAVEATRTLAPDVLFLDIQLTDVHGFDVVNEVGGLTPLPAVVFVTAFDQYAVDAFRVNAVDYLLKPVDGEEIAAALQRVRTQIDQRKHADAWHRIRAALTTLLPGDRAPAGSNPVRADAAPTAGAQTAAKPGARGSVDRLVVRKGRRIGFVTVGEIDWIEARGNACRVHAKGEVHVVQAMLGNLEASLDPNVFTRIHRSTIVNWSRVAELRPLAANDYAVLLRDGTRLRLSRFYRERIRETFLAGM